MNDILSARRHVEGLTNEQRNERAQLAVKNFRSMQRSLTGFARALTGKKDVRVELDTGAPRTDGSRIFFRPPLGLGVNATHTRSLCDKRDENVRLLCEACRIREEVMAPIYHEISHIAFDSFAPTLEAHKVSLTARAIEEWGTKYAEQIKARIDAEPSWRKDNYKAMAGLISPFLPPLLNALEDARVNASMFRARPGIKVMMKSHVYGLLGEGIETDDGGVWLWRDQPLNAQITVACFVMGAGYDIDPDWFHETVYDALGDTQLYDLCVEAGQARRAAEVYEISFKVLARLRELGFCKNPDADPEEEEEPDAEPDESDDSTDPADNGDPAGDPEPDVEPDDEGDGEAGEAGDVPDTGAGDPEASDEGSDVPAQEEAGQEGDTSPAEEPEAGTGSQGDGTSDDPDAGVSDDAESDGAPGSGDQPAGDEVGDLKGSDSLDDATGGQPDQEGGSSEPEGEAGEGSPEQTGDGDVVREGGDVRDEYSRADRDAPDESADVPATGRDNESDEADQSSAGEPDQAESGEDSERESDGPDGSDGDGDPVSGDGEPDDAGQGSDDGSPEEAGPGELSDEGQLPDEVRDDRHGGDRGGSDQAEESAGEPDSEALDRDGVDDADAEPEAGSDEGVGDLSDLDALPSVAGSAGEPSEGGVDDDGTPARSTEVDGGSEPAEGAGKDGTSDDESGEASEEGSAQTRFDWEAENEGRITDTSDGGGDPTRQSTAPESEATPDPVEEPFDMRGDEGMGGVLDDTPVPEYGTPEEVEAALKLIENHGEPPKSVMRDIEAANEALDTAIIQGVYFETPSQEVWGVRVHREGEPGLNDRGEAVDNAWNHKRIEESGITLKQAGVECDMDVPEAILGKALLHTRRVFDANKTSVYTPNLRSGRVNGRVLGKRAWSGDDRLFGKKRVPGKRDYFVLIGMDCSGSTVGSNLALSKRAANAQADLCQRAGVPFAIYAHTFNNRRGLPFESQGGVVLDMYEIKTAEEPWDEQRKNRLANLGPDGGNLDGHTLEFYRKRLDEVQATDKIILYYTDGRMPASNYDEELEILQREIKTCKAKGYTLLGVGIRTNSPVRHGLDTVRVDNDENIRDVVVHLEKRLSGPR